jgi:ubiquinone/menaquinone biosynthesis C-methylase UbiE
MTEPGSDVTTKEEFENDYLRRGFAAQRRYPNEELLRFLGRHYFSLPKQERAEMRALEVGCGTGANLWMIAKEGFDTYGIDLSPAGLRLCNKMLDDWAVSANLAEGSMTSLPYDDSFFDVVVDVVSSYCLNEKEFVQFLDEVTRTTKPGGRFFSFTPSQNSDSFREPGPSAWIDASTLKGIRNRNSPYFGQASPFRFVRADQLAAALKSRNFEILQNERIGRTYFNGAKYFEFVSIVAEKAR